MIRLESPDRLVDTDGRSFEVHPTACEIERDAEGLTHIRVAAWVLRDQRGNKRSPVYASLAAARGALASMFDLCVALNVPERQVV